MPATELASGSARAAVEPTREALVCPKCQAPMAPYEHEGVTIDLCPRCRGLWFDRGELARLDEVRLEIAVTPRAGGSRLACPRCRGVLSEGTTALHQELRLDACQGCGGLFLDRGELRRVQQLALRERRRAAEQKARDERSAAAAADEALRPAQEFARRNRLGGGRAEWGFAVGNAWESQRSLVSFLLGLPVEEEATLERTPRVVLGLVTTIAIVFVLQLFTDPAVWLPLATVPREIAAGRHLESLITAVFLHGGFIHLLGNLYFLWTFGDDVADRLGGVAFLLWYLAWGLLGSIGYVMLASPAQQQVPGLGASGAISGVLGAYLVLFPRRKIITRLGGFLVFGVVVRTPAWAYLGFWAALQLVSMGLKLPGVGWGAHVAGLMAGVFVGAGYRALQADRARERAGSGLASLPKC